MRRQPWVIHLVALGTLCLLATVSFARPHDDPAHRSGLPITLTLADGTRRTAALRGVGCTQAICSLVRAQQVHADNVWLDGLASIRNISGEKSGPVHVVLRFKDGTERTGSITETNRVLYLTGSFGRDRKVDLARVGQVDFN